MPHGLRPVVAGDSLVQYSVLRIERCLFSLSSPSSGPQDAPENGEDRSDRRQTHAWRWPFHPHPLISSIKSKGMSHPSGWACHQPSTRTPSQPPPHSIVRVLTQERTLRLGSLLPWSMKGEEKEWVQPSMDSAGKERGMTGESSFLCADCPVRGGLDPFWQFLRAADSFVRAVDSCVRAADSSSELFREGCNN